VHLPPFVVMIATIMITTTMTASIMIATTTDHYALFPSPKRPFLQSVRKAESHLNQRWPMALLVFPLTIRLRCGKNGVTWNGCLSRAEVSATGCDLINSMRSSHPFIFTRPPRSWRCSFTRRAGSTVMTRRGGRPR